jgi:hypothetical protein
LCFYVKPSKQEHEVALQQPCAMPFAMQVEVIMVERQTAGQSAGQFSIGWAQLPLFANAAGLGAMPGSQAAAAPLMSGTPRYLLFRCVAAG